MNLLSPFFNGTLVFQRKRIIKSRHQLTPQRKIHLAFFFFAQSEEILDHCKSHKFNAVVALVRYIRALGRKAEQDLFNITLSSSCLVSLRILGNELILPSRKIVRKVVKSSARPRRMSKKSKVCAVE